MNSAPTDLYNMMTQIWLNEKLSEQILEYREAELQEILLEIERVDKKIEELNEDPQKEEMALIQELELDRLKFMLKDYLRIRLKKIEKFIFFLVAENKINILSNEEIKFAMAYFKERKEYCNTKLLNRVGKESFNWFGKQLNKEFVVMPNENSYCFIKSIDNFETTIKNPIDMQNENFFLSRNEVALVREKEIEKFLAENRVKLI